MDGVPGEELGDDGDTDGESEEGEGGGHGRKNGKLRRWVLEMLGSSRAEV
ncbi:MAG: hypothetical protein P8J87_00255 [Verrucomicrobiales bacterium]|nr:hypothetical protein [Verrucomicrobiales bacterium]